MIKSSAHSLPLIDPSMSMDVNFEIYYHAYRSYDAVYCIHLPKQSTMLTYESVYGTSGLCSSTIMYLLMYPSAYHLTHSVIDSQTPCNNLPLSQFLIPQESSQMLLPSHTLTPTPSHTLSHPLAPSRTLPLSHFLCITGVIAHYRNATAECSNVYIPKSVTR